MEERHFGPDHWELPEAEENSESPCESTPCIIKQHQTTKKHRSLRFINCRPLDQVAFCRSSSCFLFAVFLFTKLSIFVFHFTESPTSSPTVYCRLLHFHFLLGIQGISLSTTILLPFGRSSEAVYLSYIKPTNQPHFDDFLPIQAPRLSSLTGLSMVYDRMRDFHRKKELLEKSVTIMERSFGVSRAVRTGSHRLTGWPDENPYVTCWELHHQSLMFRYVYRCFMIEQHWEGRKKNCWPSDGIEVANTTT